MSPIIEREEGLFTRHGLTRAACILIVMAYVGAAALAVAALWSIFVRRDWLLLSGMGAAPLALMGIFSLGFILRFWRRCDRCRKRLFSDEEYSVGWRGVGAGPARHHAAPQLFGSYRNAATIRMAFAGRLRCQWCGHDDGSKPDYVVRGS